MCVCVCVSVSVGTPAAITCPRQSWCLCEVALRMTFSRHLCTTPARVWYIICRLIPRFASLQFASLYACMQVYMYMYVCVSLSLCTYVCMYACVCVRVCAWVSLSLCREANWKFWRLSLSSITLSRPSQLSRSKVKKGEMPWYHSCAITDSSIPRPPLDGTYFSRISTLGK